MRPFIVSLLSLQAYALTAQSLNSDAVAWSVTNANGSLSLPAVVPGEVHLDLQRAGVIGDPSFGLNELQQRWIASENWTFVTASFNVTQSLWSQPNIDLWLTGLDTAANVSINGVSVLDTITSGTSPTANMHRRFIVPLRRDGGSPLGLQSSGNNLSVGFMGPVPFSALQMAACNSDYCPAPWAGPAPVPMVNNAFIRKMQASFSWDFAPAIGTSGVWGDVSLIGYSTAWLSDVIVKTQPSSGSVWSAVLSTRVWSSGVLSAVPATTTVALYDAAGRLVAANTTNLTITASGAYIYPSVTVYVDSPSLWWPHGYGAPYLYTAVVTFSSQGDTTSQNISVGFRTVTLQQPVVFNGTLFYYEVNNVPIYARGSNWVPADMFNTRVTAAYLRDLLLSAIDANMNMLRVWGGGIYPTSAFLDIADELGIMITVDAQFGDQFYNVDPIFLSNVAEESVDNTWRTASHPSIVLWCGNNEMGSGYADDHHLYQDAAYYSQLYFATILNNITAIDSSRPVVSSTPSNGNETAAQPFHPGMSIEWKGDVHFYEAFVDAWDPTTYPRARFVTESGQESWPSLLTVLNATQPEDWSFNSTVMAARNHHPPGQYQITDMVERHWFFPNVTATSHAVRHSRVVGSSNAALPPNATLLGDQLWASQLAAAECMRAGVHHWRRISDEYNATTPGGNRGILYWQLNDMWSAPSWSSIEVDARWKVLQHYAVRFFADTLPSVFAVGITDAGAWSGSSGPDPTTITVAAYVSTWDATAVGAAVMRMSLWSWAAGLVAQWEEDIFVPAAPAAIAVWNTSLSSLLQRASGSVCQDMRACVLSYHLVLANGAVVPDTNEEWMYLSPLQLVSTMVNPQLALTSIVPGTTDAYGRQTLNVTITALHLPAAAVWLETPLGGHFSDNAFLMTVPTVTLTWTQHPSRPGAVAPGAVTPAQLAANLAIWSLYDVDTRYSATAVSSQHP